MSEHGKNSRAGYAIVASPLGEILITGSATAITGVYINPEHQLASIHHNAPSTLPHITAACQQLAEYFAGTRREFNLPIEQTGTVFQQQVWAALCTIPFGELRSYRDICHTIGSPTAFRAVGSANGQNKIAIIVPCHRVIAANGKLSGYAGGIEVKQWLINHEAKYGFELNS